MNYYERHLGDYARDTAHLSMVEHGAYTLLMDRYYATEKGIPEDQAHRVARARTAEERAAVDAVLAEFFMLANGLWTQKRVEQEVERFKDKQNKARASANARWSNSERNADAMPTHSEGNALQSPVTSNQEKQEQRAQENGKPEPKTLLCMAIIKAGFPAPKLNQSDPRLSALIDAGVTPEEAGDAAREAIALGKCSIGYIVGTINGRRKDAAKPIAPKHQPPKPSSHTIVKPTPTSLTPEQCEANQARLKNLLGDLAA